MLRLCWLVLVVSVAGDTDPVSATCLQVKGKLHDCAKFVQTSDKYSDLMEMTFEEQEELYLVTFFLAMAPPRAIFVVEKEVVVAIENSTEVDIEKVMVSRTCEICPPAPERREETTARPATELERLYRLIRRFKAAVAVLEEEAERDWTERIHCQLLTEVAQVKLDFTNIFIISITRNVSIHSSLSAQERQRGWRKKIPAATKLILLVTIM